MKTTLTTQSRLKEIDFNQLSFGHTFSDHMLMCRYKNGQWEEAEILPYQAISFAPGTHVFHYGQAVFEGMKAYHTEEGNTMLFRAKDNWARLNQSAERMCMPGIPEAIFMDGLKELLTIDKEWIPKEDGKSLYIRPFIMACSEFIRATPADEFLFFIITSPTASYYVYPLKGKVQKAKCA